MIIWTKIKMYALAFISILVTGVSIWFAGRSKGKQSEQVNTQKAKSEAVSAKANSAQMESRHATDVKVSKLPDAPTQKVADAGPATAAGKLRDNGWVRD